MATKKYMKAWNERQTQNNKKIKKKKKQVLKVDKVKQRNKGMKIKKLEGVCVFRFARTKKKYLLPFSLFFLFLQCFFSLLLSLNFFYV
jgi:hypothetical protein